MKNKKVSASANVDRGRLSRARVLKACNNCRLRKAKCDGTQPCSRCEAHNAICVFGGRKMPPKNHPRGYVEMLEQQQGWLIKGLREMYRRAIQGKGWPGEPLRQEADDHPLTHDILFCLGVLNKAEQPDKMCRGNTVDVSYSEQAPASVLSGGYPYQIPPSSSLPQLAEHSRQTLCLSPGYFESTESEEQQAEPNSGYRSVPTSPFPISPLSIPDEINLVTTGDQDHHPITGLAPSSEVEFAELDSTKINSHSHSSWLTSIPIVSSYDSSISPLVIETAGTEECVTHLWSMFP